MANLDRAVFEIFGQFVVVLGDSAQHRFSAVLGLRRRQSAGTLGLLSIIGSAVHIQQTAGPEREIAV